MTGDQARPAIRNFAFHEDLVRVVPLEGRPWFVAPDVCRVLDLKNVTRSLGRLPKHAVALHSVKGDGGDRRVNIVSEGGLYRLVFTSRVPKAEEIVDWVADEVLPAIRENGFYAAKGIANGDAVPPFQPEDEPRSWPVIQKLQAVQLCARIHGRLRAEAMWRQVGLPLVPPPPATALDEARVCLRHLLDALSPASSAVIRDLIEAALDEHEEARTELIYCGIRVYPDRDAFLIANSHPKIAEIFAKTEWSHGRYGRVLRRLPGVGVSTHARFSGINRRGVLVPSDYLDGEASPAPSAIELH